MIPKLLIEAAEAKYGKDIPLLDGIDMRLPAKDAWQESEHSLQKAFFAYLSELIGKTNNETLKMILWTFHAIPNGGLRTKSEASKFKAEGVKSGIPDTFLPLPKGGFAGLYIEFKKAGGSISLEQRYFLNLFNDLGYCCYVVNDLESAVTAFATYYSKAPSK